MSEPLRGVVVSHGPLADALVKAVQRITGDADALTAVTNEGCDRDRLAERLREAIGEGPALVFVDLPSGSCLQASASYIRQQEGFAIVTGVNLPMLIDFIYNRDATPVAAAERAAAKGESSVRVVKP